MMKKHAESDIKPPEGCAGRIDRRGGYVIPLILVAALIGVLFGIGRLTMFRYQAQIRIDRQFELEKVMATRSGVNWLMSEVSGSRPVVPTVPANFIYQIREQIGVEVRPAKWIYPSNSNHLDLQRGVTNGLVDIQLSSTTNMQPYFVTAPPENHDFGLARLFFDSAGIDDGERGRIEISMPDLGLWTDDPTGRRYWFEIAQSGDLIRFALTPIGQAFNHTNHLGGAAIWIEQDANADVTLFIRDGDTTKQYGPVTSINNYGKCLMMTGSRITVLEWSTITDPSWDNKETAPPIIGQFSPLGLSETIPEDVLEAFSSAKDLQVTLEVESARFDDGGGLTSFSLIRVQPAYEFEVELDWLPSGIIQTVSEVSTPVHLREEVNKFSGAAEYPLTTYDTHGVSRLPEPSGN